MRPRIVFFDIETRKWAATLRPDDVEAGWDELRNGKGGISALAIYDTRDSYLYLYDDTTAETAGRHLEAADLVVGFCSDTFDVPCLEGTIHRRLRLRQHYDIYTEIVRANAKKGISGRRGDFKLDRLSNQNLGRGKIEHGSNAPELARKGHWAKLFNYCADDVHLTRDLFAHICKNGGLINLGGNFTSLDIADSFKKVMEVYS